MCPASLSEAFTSWCLQCSMLIRGVRWARLPLATQSVRVTDGPVPLR